MMHDSAHQSVNPDLTKLYWQARQKRLENPLGKRNAVLAAAKLVKAATQKPDRRVRVLELGCGEGHLLGALLDICGSGDLALECIGVDIQDEVIERASSLYPSVRFAEADYTSREVLGLGGFDIVMLVNTLHEVYSAGYSSSLGEIDQTVAKHLVMKALGNATELVRTDGAVVLFDGIESPLADSGRLVVRFLHSRAFDEFRLFADGYRAFHIVYEQLDGSNRIEISVRDFTRYITKTIFLGTPLWEIERYESYQYYSEAEFRSSFAELGFVITELRYMSPSYAYWTERVVIETPGGGFPDEHVLLICRRVADDIAKSCNIS